MKVYYMNVKSINADDEKWFKYLSQKRIEKVNHIPADMRYVPYITKMLALTYNTCENVI